MDRSVDSIGSCSLDVDADSTDFSDTSGELNFLTPNSAKDIQREFTAGIKERCKIPVINCQAVTTVLDPVTGNISTVLTTTSPQAADTATTAAATVDGAALPNKKPSYLNLACCVNGYSNLTTYDSKLRQDINKSREVSPSRPIIATLHYNRSSEGGNFQLTAPTLSYISMNNSINNNLSNGARMVNGRATAAGANGGQDVTDNVSVNAAAAMFNGNGFGGLRTKVISSQSQISSVRESERVVKKSFIQQRVEKLYGNAEGVVINKQIYSHSNNSGSTNERKYLNNIANENVSVNKNCFTSPASAVHLNGNGNANGTNGSATNNGVGGGVVTKENLDVTGKEFGGDPDMEALPVMRHLRPEFRAQLQLYSPKKVPKASPGRLSNGSSNGVASAGSLNGGSNNNNNHIASNRDLSHHHHSHLSQHLTNGKLTTNGTSSTKSATSSLLSSSTFSSSTSVATVIESKTSTTKSSSYQTTAEASSSLSAAATATTTKSENAANACDATGPTTATSNQHSERESPSTIAVEPAAAAAVTAQASDKKEATIGVEPSQEVSKMKLSEPCVNGGDGVDNVAIIRNGTTALIKNGHHCQGHEEDDKENINGGVVPELAPSVPKVVVATPVKDGNHFLQVMKNEQNRLLAMAADIERVVEQCKTDGVEISEEVAGYVLVAAGKARLLCSQKMKQFEGLCHNNLNQIPGEKFQTTNEDLQGFWDMVMLQVHDVDASFVEIDSFRRNDWKKPTPVSPVPQARSTARSTKLTKRPFKAPASTASNGSSADAEAKKAAAAKRVAERKQQLAELKRKQKLASAAQLAENVEIYVPGSSANSAEVVSNGVATS
uniref:Putative guanylate-kinase-associated protein n=1 Tax=Culex tarsalis TaxID=7177 RepID=A0A1Q3FW25_CULTA